jgi:hypothetical protein
MKPRGQATVLLDPLCRRAVALHECGMVAAGLERPGGCQRDWFGGLARRSVRAGAGRCGRLLRQLARDHVRQAAGHARHVDRQLLVQQVGAQVAAGTVQHAGFHGGLAHALDQLAHEQRFELLGRLLDRSRRVLAGLSLSVFRDRPSAASALVETANCENDI